MRSNRIAQKNPPTDLDVFLAQQIEQRAVVVIALEELVDVVLQSVRCGTGTGLAWGAPGLLGGADTSRSGRRPSCSQTALPTSSAAASSSVVKRVDNPTAFAIL